MTRDRDLTSICDQTQTDPALRPSDLKCGVLVLVRPLILVCALLVCTDSSKAAPVMMTQTQSEEGERVNLTVAVTDAQTDRPINQARLTLEFTEPGDPSKLRRSKKLSYSAKTNAQGHYKFPSLPKGTIRLIVTAERHQTFSKEFELEKENEVIEVKLKKPQPLL